MALDVKDIREAVEYDSTTWQPIRDEAKIDMRYVAGDPWDDIDKQARKDRPTVAPEEMGQYFNQVINALRANPRGMKFSPVGGGASEQSAEFYQNKAREIEYRSHASLHYIQAAENAIQRSYGFVEVTVGYESPRSANQEISIGGFPNPDMVLPDADALMPDSSDMKRCTVYRWELEADFKRQYKRAKVQNFADWATIYPSWVKGGKVLVAKHWAITTRKRQLVLVELPSPAMPGQPPSQPISLQVFKDEVTRYPGARVVRDLREVDYPDVRWYLTNGIEILDDGDWLGKHIPVVSCYGKVLFIEGKTGMERKILSMTRFGRDPWKSYCYACSQQLEVLAMVPKAPLRIPRGSMNKAELALVERSMHEPIAAITYAPFVDGTTQPLPPPDALEYPTGQHLQSLELVKEGFRRAIQAAMGSNFLPTQAQRRNEKSGVALDKIEQAATQGTYHFVNSYEDMIRQVGVICEDLMDKIYDYRGEVGVLKPDGTALRVQINDPNNPEAISTKGDHLVTVSTAPSSDSEREAVADFLDVLVGRIGEIAQIAGPKPAAAIFAHAVRMRNLGPMGDQLADIIEPPEFKQQDDGQRPDPEKMALQSENQQMKQVLSQAAQEKQAKIVEQQGKFAIAKMQEEHEDQRAAADRETKITVAELGAKVDRLALFLEERERVGLQRDAMLDRLMTRLEATKDRLHEAAMAKLDHAHTLDQQTQAAALIPQPGDEGAGASA